MGFQYDDHTNLGSRASGDYDKQNLWPHYFPNIRVHSRMDGTKNKRMRQTTASGVLEVNARYTLPSRK